MGAPARSRAPLFLTPWTVAHQALLWDFPGKNMEWHGCHVLCQAIFLTPGSNPGLLHCRRILHQLSYQRGTRDSLTVEFPLWFSW